MHMYKLQQVRRTGLESKCCTLFCIFLSLSLLSTQILRKAAYFAGKKNFKTVASIIQLVVLYFLLFSCNEKIMSI